MINEISRILVKFRPCFIRKAAFNWFVIVIVGFIVRLDHYGVSSFVRWLCIKPSLYTALLSFFRASSWQLKDIMHRWWQIVLSGCPLLHIVTRAKSNVVGYQDPPSKTGRPGRPREYGAKLKLMDLFETMAESFEQTTIEIYGQCEEVSFP